MRIAPASPAWTTGRSSKSPAFSTPYCGPAPAIRIGVDFIQHFPAAQRLHLTEDPFAPLLNVAGGRCRRQALRVRQYGGERGGIGAREPGCRLVEKSLCGGFRTIGPEAKLGDVQIDFQNAPF